MDTDLFTGMEYFFNRYASMHTNTTYIVIATLVIIILLLIILIFFITYNSSSNCVNCKMQNIPQYKKDQRQIYRYKQNYHRPQIKNNGKIYMEENGRYIPLPQIHMY